LLALFFIFKRFNMKKWILASALLLALGGTAAAQAKAQKNAHPQKAVKKGNVQKTGVTTKTVQLKSESVNGAKIPMPLIAVDTSSVPIVKQD
jgi:uncharacterized protein YdeI (BOF family)